jgi:multicomponent Na+:H+ antiporter subunit E
VGFVITWILLAALWIGLSGFFDPVHLTFGFVSVTLVSLISHRHLTGQGRPGSGMSRTVRFVLYLPWLLWQIVLANIDVALRVMGFRDVNPSVIRFRPELDSEFGEVTLANSITLTPGTVTMEIEDGEFIVHAVSPEAAEAVLEGAMTRKVQHLEGRA